MLLRAGRTFAHIILVFLSTCELLQVGAVPVTADSGDAASDHRVIKIDKNNYNDTKVQEIMRLAKSQEMQNFMEESVQPCDDFYEFACGEWLRINPANSIEHLTTGLFEKLSRGLDLKMERLLEEGVMVNDTEIDKKVKKFYESCTKVTRSRKKYLDELHELIEEFGEMPAKKGKDWNGTHFDWLETVAQISLKYGIDVIIGVDVMPDFKDNSVNRIYIAHPDLTLESRAMYFDESTQKYRETYQKKIANELEAYFDLKSDVASVTAKEILDFEISLAGGLTDDLLGLSLDDLSSLTTLNELQKKYAPDIDIERFITIVFGKKITEPIYEFNEDYQKNLVNVIRKTPKRIIANYIFYSLLDDFILKIAKQQSKQKKICMDKTKNYFSKNLDNMIYRKYFTTEIERDVNFIWEELKETFKSHLLSNKLGWIRVETRQYAIEKLNAMKLEVNTYANFNFTEEFDGLVISDDDYIENIKNILKSEAKRTIANLNKPPKPIEAGEVLSYTPVNIIIENTIKVPVSLLQPYYLWAANYPNALKFGTLGALVGHEMVHGFDDTGRSYDKSGNNREWWDAESTKEFVERTKCFSKQYSQYEYGGRKLPYSNSQSENIADNGGIRLAYYAYLKWYEEAIRSGEDMRFEVLPTLNYTSKQLFFLSFAQVWCSDIHPKVKDLQTSTDSHMPGMYRVIGSLSNFDEFSKEFQCPKGSTMNPGKVCEIY